MIQKHRLECCALCQLTAGNNTTIEEIEGMLKTLKEQTKYVNKKGQANGIGQRACFIIVTPAEAKLKQNVENLGFICIAEFDRRNGYEQIGKLKMYFLNW